MRNRWNKEKTFGVLALGTVVIMCIGRWMPHPPNFTPMVGAAIFGGAMLFRKWIAVAIPVLAFWISDLFLNNLIYTSYFDGFVWFSSNFVFAAIALSIIALFSTRLSKGWSALKVAGFSLSSSVIFFLISNFGVWAAMHSIYPKTFSGLLTAYAAGLPYLFNGMAGDLFYCTVFFGGFALYQHYSINPGQLKTEQGE